MTMHSDIEDLLRDGMVRFTEGIRAPDDLARTVSKMRWRPVASRPILVPLAAAAATIAIVAGVTVAVRSTGGPGQPAGIQSVPVSADTVALPQPVLGSGTKAASRRVPASSPSQGVPDYYVTSGGPNDATADRIQVWDTSTGKLAGSIRPPQGTTFMAIAATAGDKTFVTEAVPNPASGCPISSELYQFQLSNRGKPGQLKPLNIAIPGWSVEPGSLAITPDGRTIAYDTWLCHQNRYELGVIDLASGRVHLWDAYGTSHSQAALSLSADGSLLSYVTQFGWAESLRTSAPQGLVSQRSRVTSLHADWAALSSNGATLYTCSAPGPAPTADTAPMASTPVSTGSVTYGTMPAAGGTQHPIVSGPGLPSPQCWATLDPSGGYLLVQYPVAGQGGSWLRPAVLDLGTGQLSLISGAPAMNYLHDLAW
jgi:hypothetical protein